ncbi:E3 ubiquitin-protein ligase TRIM63-like [Glandiceps talaboti]
MASVDSDIDSELTCPVCLELFLEPLKLPCEHDLCRHCAKELLRTGDGGRSRTFARTQSGVFRCPECREIINVGDQGVNALRRNVRLQNIIERIHPSRGQQGSSTKCSGVKDEKTAILSDICDEQKTTVSHDIEVLSGKNDEIQRKIASLNEDIAVIEENSQKAKELLQDDCQQRLMEEAIEANRKRKVDTLLDNMTQLQEKMDHGIALALQAQDTVHNTEPLPFLKVYKSLKQSIHSTINDISTSLGEEHLIKVESTQFAYNFDSVRDVLNRLNFGTNHHGRGRDASSQPTSEERGTGSHVAPTTGTKGFLKISFTLDPESAHRDLILTNDKLTVRWDALGAKHRNITSSIRRFTGGMNPCVLGNLPIVQGICYWEASVNRSVMYRIGVILSKEMNRRHQLGTNSASWCLRYNHGVYKVVHADKEVSIRVLDEPDKIGVCLDCDNNTLAVYDSPRRRLLHKWHNLSFRGEIFPAFYVGRDGCLTIHTGLQVPHFCRHT